MTLMMMTLMMIKRRSDALLFVFRGIERKFPRKLLSLPWKISWLSWKPIPFPRKLLWKPWQLPWKPPASIAVETSTDVCSGSFRHVEAAVETSMEAMSMDFHDSFRGSFRHSEAAVDKLSWKLPARGGFRGNFHGSFHGLPRSFRGSF